VGAESIAGVVTAGVLAPLPQEVNRKMRRSPKKDDRIDFMVLIPSKV
jgi:hypothetical protein